MFYFFSPLGYKGVGYYRMESTANKLTCSSASIVESYPSNLLANVKLKCKKTKNLAVAYFLRQFVNLLNVSEMTNFTKQSKTIIKVVYSHPKIIY